MLLLEQPVEAKAVKEVTRKAGWQHEWRGLKLAAPLLLMVSGLCVEMGIFRLWLDDRLFCAAGVLRLLLMAVFPLVAVLLAVVVPLLFASLPFVGNWVPKRNLCLDDKGVKLSQTKQDRVFWKYVRRWFLAPIPGCEGLVTLTLECGNTRQPSRRYWSIVLGARDQKYAFLAELEHLRQVGWTTAPVIELLRPMPQRPVCSVGLWAMAVAFYLFIHGFPLLAVGALPHDSKGSDSRLTPAEQNKMERLMRPVMRRLHIANENQLRMLFWLPGGLLSAGAIGIWVWGNRRQSQKTVEINQVYDSALEVIMRPGSVSTCAAAPDEPSREPGG